MSDLQPKVTRSQYIPEKKQTSRPPTSPFYDESGEDKGGLKLFRALRMVLAAILFFYGLIINVYFAAHFACWDCNFAVAQANHFAVWITLSGVLAFVLGLIFWIPKLVWLWLAPGPILFLVWFGPNFLPKSEPDANGFTFTAATYNIQDELGDTPQIYNNVVSINADIIAFQEMSPDLQTRIETEQLYPYVVTGVRRSELLGIASRFPILENEMFDGQFLRAVVDMNGQRVVVYNLHAPNADIDFGQRTFNDAELNDSIKKVLEQIKQESDPVLLLCDCNTTPRTRQYSWIQEVLDDSFAQQGSGFGHTHRGADFVSFATIRIDYIWHSDRLTPLEVGVWNDDGSSDHFPVRGQLVLES